MSPDSATPMVGAVGIAATAATGLASLMGPLAALIALAVGMAALGATAWWVARELSAHEEAGE